MARRTMPDPVLHDTFLREVAGALHACGSPAPDLERHITELGRRLGLRVSGFALPTMFALTIDEPDGRQRVQMLRLPPSDYNMVRLMALEELVAGFTGPESLDEAEKRLREIRDTPPPWRGAGLAACGFLLSASVAALFKGGYAEMICGGAVGVAFVYAYLWLARRPRLDPVTPVLLCAGAALLARVLAFALPNQSVFITILAGIVLLLPGFTTTIALSELATRNLLAGSGRMAGAFILMIMMGAGVAIGSKLADVTLPAAPPGVTTPVPAPVFWLSIAALGFSFLGALQAPLRSAFVSMGAALAAWGVMSPAVAALGPIGGALLAAFAVSFGGHLYHRVTGKPVLLFQVPGLLTLVPGSVGFRGLDALIQQDFLKGIQITTEMLLTGTALAVGILLANGLAPILLNPGREKIDGPAPGIL